MLLPHAILSRNPGFGLIGFAYSRWFTMAEQHIPEDVARFVLDKIDSVAQLEALLLLRGDKEKEWSVETMAARLYISEEQTAHLLRGLSAQGFVAAKSAEPELYRYEPASAELHQMLGRVAEFYAKHLVPITNLIHSKPKPRIQEFAEAFRLRKDK
jgi:hypothetical protein